MEAKSVLNQPQVKAYAMPILLVLAAIALVPLFALPTWGDIQDLQSDIQRESDRIETLKEKNSNLLDFADQSQKLGEQFSLFETAITSESKVPELLTQIQAVSDSCGLSVESLQFGGEGESQTPGGSTREVRVRYSAKGNFSQVECVVKTFESSLRLVDVDSLRFSSSESSGGSLVLSPEITFVAYYTPQINLVADSPLNFSFSDPTYIKSTQILKALK